MEIDLEYQHAKKFNNKYVRFLPFVIGKLTYEVSLESKKNTRYYPILNEKFLKKTIPSDKVPQKIYIYIYIGVWAFFAILLPLLISIRHSELIGFNYYLIYFALGLPFPFLAYRAWKKYSIAPEKIYITFDRLNSLLTMPTIDEQSYFTIPFSHLKAATHALATTGTYGGMILIFKHNPKPRKIWGPFDYIPMSFGQYKPKAVWSFYVWYMDKNRPLPPGEVFDEFREVDFERRKAAGFPPPLFKSSVPTPEATPEQQLVREAFWKDKDYMATEREAAFSVSPLSKHYKGFLGEKREE